MHGWGVGLDNEAMGMIRVKERARSQALLNSPCRAERRKDGSPKFYTILDHRCCGGLVGGLDHERTWVRSCREHPCGNHRKRGWECLAQGAGRLARERDRRRSRDGADRSGSPPVRRELDQEGITG